ncbi:hypothetical protein N7495_004779 [Penicillium taxi]|uniref:uncharacterized protein n=1 Tax=Penicillium taxi TaxID=168475 RepID=UPI002544ECB3|nr:uncharacterized protein N7495_004779 [Penicillium taxi]KAJ5900035.1 hypothetical protein N7495_004779 [Penicillium taxi]
MNKLKQAERNDNGESDDSNTIARSDITNSAITSSYVKRSKLEGCVLSHVRLARRVTGQKTHFHNVDSVGRSEFSNSVVRDRSSVARSTIIGSTVRDASAIKRSTIAGSTISGTQTTRTLLENCDVEDCVILRSEFKGMVLKNGLWKKGQLIGRVGAKPPVAIRKDGSSVVSVENSQF